MTGPEHYRRAEEALGILDELRDPDDWKRAIEDGALATAIGAAQVHATLALAAATIGPITAGWQGDAAEETERAVQDELDARPVGRHMTRHVYEPDEISKQWEEGTVQHDSVARQEELGKARWQMQDQLNRLGIWNRPERLALVELQLQRAGMWDTDRDHLAGFHEVSIAEALAVAARLAEEPTPDVDAGV